MILALAGTTSLLAFVSASEPRDPRRCYELGANGYVVKPISFEDLSEAVADLGGLDEPPPEETPRA